MKNLDGNGYQFREGYTEKKLTREIRTFLQEHDAIDVVEEKVLVYVYTPTRNHVNKNTLCMC